ncbi:50S ribosomal protein L39e [uncultured archaeon]|nr:50S ribosomal protein L39e [uncultured archaeon]
MKAKTDELKHRLAKALNQNRRVPLFVIAKTKRKISRNSKTRNWRQSKIKKLNTRNQKRHPTY